MTKLIYSLMLFFIGISLCYAQPKPLNDSTWQLAFADEFNTGTKPDSSKWNFSWDNCPGKSYADYTAYYHGATAERVTNEDSFAYRSPHYQNCDVDSGSLKISSKKEHRTNCKVWDRYVTGSCWGQTSCPIDSLVTFEYTTGMLQSKTSFKYGYYEISVKLPDAASANANMGLGPNFWLYAANDTCKWSEIDVFEFAGKEFATGQSNYHTGNVHYQKYKPSQFGVTTTNPADTIHTGDQSFLGHISFSSNYHIFAIDWKPEKIDFYYDGTLYKTSILPGIYPNKLIEMRMLIDVNLPTLNFDMLQDTNMVSPFIYDINYVRCWQYKQNCDSVLSQCNFNTATFDPAVYKEITVGGSGCSSPIASGKNISFRANDFVLLQEGFEVQAGAEFLGEVTPCYEYANPTNRTAPPNPDPFNSPFSNEIRIKNKHQ